MFTALRETFAAPAARFPDRAPKRPAGKRAAMRMDATPLAEPPCGRGHIDRLDDGFLSGWAAGPDGEPLEALVTVWVDGLPITVVESFTYRADLEQAGIARGRAAFEVDIGEAIRPGAREIDVALALGDDDAPRFFARQRVPLPDHRPLNPEPYLRRVASGEVPGWGVECDTAVRLDDFPISGPLLHHADRYVRFALVGGETTLRLATPLDGSRSTGLAELALGLMLRADRPVDVRCRILVDGACAGELTTRANAVWRLEHHALPIAAGASTDPRSERTLELTVAHPGRGHVDVALCCAGENVSFRYLRRVHAVPLDIGRVAVPASRGERSYLDNGRFERWSRGVDFGDLTGGDSLPDNWRFEGRADQMRHVSVSAQSVPHAAKAARTSFGLRVRTGGFEGAMRLEAGLDMHLLDESGLTVRATFHATGANGFALVRRVLLLGGEAEREAVVAVLSRGIQIRGSATVDVLVDEAWMVRIRRGVADLGSLRLACEFERNADVLVEAMSVTSATRADVASPGGPGAPEDGGVEGFEDPDIVAQLDSVRGLENWLDGARCTDAELVDTAPAARAGAIGDGGIEGLDDLEAATVRRPRPDYPTVNVIVPIHNALDSVRECVRSVLERTAVPYTLVLVDDGCNAETGAWLAAVARQFPNVALLVNESNLGYTRTVNNGLRHCDADYACVLNSDCVVTSGWLERLVDCAVDTGAAMVGPLSNAASYQSVPRIRADGQWCFNPLPEAASPESVAALVNAHSVRGRPAVRIINGFCQLISREAIETVGLLDEEAFPRGFGEENDYCARVVEAGLGIHVADDTYVFHAKSQSFGHAQRKTLSAEGSDALARKHPLVDWNELTAELEHQPAIAQLRERLVENGL